MPNETAILAELAQLRKRAAPFEKRGQFDTAHHKMIARLEALLEDRGEYGTQDVQGLGDQTG